ncbi:dienelactone hydrolase family protein [Pararhizobium sp. IMCC21322]|uniref:dienelactone hydrolase family protein n=1 Tax=Pararhizobium sp. IMCC21322 TaxID=3067903 RepID=UPI002741E5F5|nr:dienelactone hydrolase family protein [Pararhizobium sp. IMCC21322]
MTGTPIEEFIDIPTHHGTMQTFIARPRGPSPTCAILYMDVFGLREELFELAREYARRGITAVVPDLFHRLPVSRFTPVNDEGGPLAVEAKEANMSTELEMTVAYTKALTTTLGMSHGFSIPPRFFALGYCMGGRHALAACEAFPDEFIGGISAHGGRLVTPDTQSPHLLVPRIKVPFHFAFAADDPTCPDAHCATLKDSAGDSSAPVTFTLHTAHHGWSFPCRWSYDWAAAKAVHDMAVAMIKAAD